MRVDIKAKWVAALRSNEYIQCQFKCKDYKGCFCVTGVLYDLVAKEGRGTWFGEDFIFVDTCNQKASVNNAGLSEELIEYLELTKKSKKIPPSTSLKIDNKNKTHKALWSLNDHGKSFSELADLIENSEVYV